MTAFRMHARTAAILGLAVAVVPLSTWVPARADELATALEPHVGHPLDLVELATGRRFVRPVLEGVTARDERTTALKLRAEEGGRTVTVPLSGISRIIAGRETIHEARPAAGRPRGRGDREAAERLTAESVARMRERGVEPWPTLSAEEHARAVAEIEAFVETVRGEFPTLAVSRTHEFIVASDIPPAQLMPFTAKLDAMHDFLCDLYGIPRGEPVWKGKCLVVTFLREEEFAAFERRFMQVDSRGAHGLCHQRSDGRVVMACHRGTDAATFGHVLVHETSHGFNHRWLSPEPLPNWLNEGIAEWVGLQVVPTCRQVPMKEARAVSFMKSGGTVGRDFFSDDPDHHIEAVQYGIASGLVRFLVARDRRRFAAFVRGVKEGMPAEESLRQAFDASLDELLAAFGRAAGAPGLKR